MAVDTGFRLCTFKKAPIYFSAQPQSHLTVLAAAALVDHPALSPFCVNTESILALAMPS